jgi:putative restriction endonuclease
MLTTYVRRFQKLRVASSRQHGEAPYKPALLLAVLEGVAEGSIEDNRIEITPELIAAFKVICTDLSASGLFTANNFSLPFYHLSGDGFWHLHTWPGLEILLTKSNSIRSFRHLRDVVAYAALDADLWLLVQAPTSRTALREALLARYFPKPRAATAPAPATKPSPAFAVRCWKSPPPSTAPTSSLPTSWTAPYAAACLSAWCWKPTTTPAPCRA